MSDRLMSIAAGGLGPHQEVYSIDESFIDLAGVRGDLTVRARVVRERIDQWIGITTCIGIGPRYAIWRFSPPSDLDAVLAATDVGEVWGVGRRIAAQLKEGGIATVLDLTRMDPASVRRRWSAVLERTVRELQGLSCIGLAEQPAPKKEIACTRSFGRPVTELWALVKAVSEFAARAAQKLRSQGSVASELLVFAHSSPFRPGPRFARSVVVPLRRPTADTALLVQAAVAGIRSIYKPGHELVKAGVMLLDLVSSRVHQGELDLEPGGGHEREKLMLAMDAINDKYGRGMLHLASSGFNNRNRQWGMRQERLTPPTGRECR